MTQPKAAAKAPNSRISPSRRVEADGVWQEGGAARLEGAEAWQEGGGFTGWATGWAAEVPCGVSSVAASACSASAGLDAPPVACACSSYVKDMG